MIFSEDELPQDVPSLQGLVMDLARRLQNAQHTIEAERKAAAQVQRQAEYFRNRLSESVRSFRLESARIRNTEFKTSMHIESKKYEDNKAKGNNIHEELRLLELDYTMSGNRHFVPVKLQRLRAQAKQLEVNQESQRHTLHQLNEQVELQEQLTSAIQQNDIQTTIALLRQGADINFVDNAGYLPLHYACVYGMYEIAELLLEWGSDYTSYLSGQAPVVLAAQNGHVNIIRLLLDYGASIEETGKSNTPPLLAALQAGNFSTVEFLLQNGAMVNAVDKAENTPLHLATRLPLDSARHLIVLLLEHGADPTRMNRVEQTPEAMALYEHHRDTALFLRDMVQRRTAEAEQRAQQLGLLDGDGMQDGGFLLHGAMDGGNNPMDVLLPPFPSATVPLIESAQLPSVASSISGGSDQEKRSSKGHKGTHKASSSPGIAQRKPMVGLRSRLPHPTRTNLVSSPQPSIDELSVSNSAASNEGGSDIQDLPKTQFGVHGLDQPSIASSVTYDP